MAMYSAVRIPLVSNCVINDDDDDDDDDADDDDYKTGLFPHLSGLWFICILQANMFNVDARLGCFESFLNQQQGQKQ